MTDERLQRRLRGWASAEFVQAERAEHRRQELRQQREQEQRREQERQRLAAVERDLRAIKAAATQAQHEQQRHAWLQCRQQLFDELGQLIRPPQPQPVQMIYLPADDGTAQLGYVDFNPDMLRGPLRWFT